MSQEVWHLCHLLGTCFQQTRTNPVPQFSLLPAEVRRLWSWLEVQSSKICSRKELADPALNLLAARTHPLCVHWLTWGEEEEWVLWALKGVGVVRLGKLLSSFPILFSCCLLLALVTPTKITNHVHTYLGSFQRKIDRAASSLCTNIVLFLNKSHLF